MVVALVEFDDLNALLSLDQHLDRAVGKLEQLKNVRQRSNPVDLVGAGFIDLRAFLGDEQDLLVVRHGGVERVDGFLASDEQRDHHVGVDDDIPQREYGNDLQRSWIGHRILIRTGSCLSVECSNAAFPATVPKHAAGFAVTSGIWGCGRPGSTLPQTGDAVKDGGRWCGPVSLRPPTSDHRLHR